MAKKYLIMCVGFTHSGKTTFAKQLKNSTKDIVVVDNDIIADFINREYKEIVFSPFNFKKKNYQDPNLKFHLSKEILIFSLNAGLNVIHASGNLGKDAQGFIEKTAKKYNYKLITIYFNFSNPFLISRIQKTKKSRSCFRLSCTWDEVFEKQRLYAKLPPDNKKGIYFEIKNMADYKKTLQKIKLILK